MKYSIENIKSYFLGNFRMFLYYSKVFGWLMRKRIRDQITIRINSMEPKCYLEGACIKCGCSTTALQMANKSCEGECYPEMLNRRQWRQLYKEKKSYVDTHRNLIWFINDNEEFEKVKL